MLKEVYEFNKIRNGFKYDRKLEIDMYSEEVKEFFDAETTAERLDALVDCSYVRMGTMCKLGYKHKPVQELPYDKSVESLMVSVLVEEMGQDIFDRAIRKAEDIVCEINAMKVNVLVDGKVQKQKDLPNATKRIDDMLNELYREREAVFAAQEKAKAELIEGRLE